MDQIGPIITGLGSATAVILGGVALLLKARSSAAKPGRLLERLWDWLEGEGLVERVPPTLRDAVRRELAPDDNPEGTS